MSVGPRYLLRSLGMVTVLACAIGVLPPILSAGEASWSVSCFASLLLRYVGLLAVLTCTPPTLPRGPPSERGAPLPGTLLAAAGAQPCAVGPLRVIAVTSIPVVWMAMCLRLVVSWVLRRVVRSGCLLMRPLSGSFTVYVALAPLVDVLMIVLVSPCCVMAPVLFPLRCTWCMGWAPPSARAEARLAGLGQATSGRSARPPSTASPSIFITGHVYMAACVLRSPRWTRWIMIGGALLVSLSSPRARNTAARLSALGGGGLD